MLTVTTEWTLCDIEDQLIALTESMETVTPEQEQGFLEDFSAALTSAAEKRDRVAHHLAHLEQQQEFAARRSRGSRNSRRSVSQHRPGSKATYRTASGRREKARTANIRSLRVTPR
jgi:hypothetical protein